MQISNTVTEKSIFTSKGKKIPRYLYHVTNEKNYNSIMKDGVIKTSHDSYLESNLNGVFLFDLKNFLKHWCNTWFSVSEGLISLSQALFSRSAYREPKIVVLRIPTKNLDTKNLRCRVELDDEMPEAHILNGDTALNQKHYTRNKRPIEYIYQKVIPADIVKKVGNANIDAIVDNMLETNTYSRDNYSRQILKQLFKSNPEEKAVSISEKFSEKYKKMVQY